MNFKKLQAMQEELDNAILAEKPEMTAEERFNKTLVALSVEVSEIANCAEHFKFWKDNKGKIDRDRFHSWSEVGTNKEWYEYYDEDGSTIEISVEQAHKLTLVEECSDALHFILSLANQLEYKIDNCFDELEERESKESLFLSLNFQITALQRFDSGESVVDKTIMQSVINIYFQYIESLDITTKELEQAYYDKNEINYKRLKEGY